MSKASNKTATAEEIMAEEDLTGRDKMARNVLIGWGSYLLVFISGFILPKMLDHYVGQVLLGIWDFSWSIVNYLVFAAPGIGSSLNRYVAKYRAARQTDKLCEAVSTVVLIQLMASGLVILLVTLVVIFLPVFFAKSIGAEITTARHVVGILGAAAAMQMALSPSRGVLTGCHRWDLLNGLQALSSLLSVATMIIVLISGGGLVGAATAYLVVSTTVELIRGLISFRVCPELSIKFRYATMEHAKEILLFGGKTIVAGLPLLLIAQTASVLVATNLGPAAVAVFARPISLVRHLQTFATKFSFMMTPAAGALQEVGDIDEMRRFLIQVTRYAVSFTLPSVLLLIIYGDALLYVWMGQNYAHWSLIAILAAGYLLPISQDPVIRILMGMNAHGRVALQSLLAGIVSFVILALIVYSYHWSLQAAGAIVAISLTITGGIVIPVYACKMFKIPYLQYCKDVFMVPVLCSIPYVLVLTGIRFVMGTELLFDFFLSAFVGGVLLMLLYWRYIFSETARCKIKKMVGFKV